MILKRKKTIIFNTASAGIDYSFSQDGNLFYYRNNNCINEVMCDSYREKEILCKEKAPQWDENTVICDYSGHRLFISGSSGNYDVYITKGQSFKKIFTTITPAEIFITDTTFILHRGIPRRLYGQSVPTAFCNNKADFIRFT